MPHLENETSDTAPVASPENDEVLTNASDGLLFSCRCESTRPISTLLSCLRQTSHTQPVHSGVNTTLTSTQSANKKQRVQFATVICSEKALTFQVYGVGKQSRARVDLNQGLFSEFFVGEQEVPMLEGEKEGEVETISGGEFGINLTTVLECLTVLGQASLDRTTLCLSYDSHSAIFKIELLEQTVGNSGGQASVIISNCAIPGMSVTDESDEDEDEDGISGLDHAFRSAPLVARARLSSHSLRDAWSELTNIGGANSVTIGLSKMGLELGSFGHSTECHVLLPYHGNVPEVFFSLEGLGEEEALYARSYPLHSMMAAMRGLEIASETCLSMNANGMIAIQHLVYEKSIGNGEPNYVDFIMGCLQEEEKEETDNSQDCDVRQKNGFYQEPFENSQTSQHEDQEGPISMSDPSEPNEVPSPHRTLTAQEEPILSTDRKLTEGDGQDEEEEEESQESKSQEKITTSLFGTVAEIRAAANRSFERRRERSRRKLSQNDAPAQSNEERGETRNTSSMKGREQEDNGSVSSQEAEFIDDNDEKEQVEECSQSSDLLQETPGSPQLMYGDTHLEM